jgi:hypothetical protein
MIPKRLVRIEMIQKNPVLIQKYDETANRWFNRWDIG